MKLIIWFIRIVIFGGLLALALANTQETALYFFALWTWHAPLILIGLAFFVMGVVVGVCAALPTYFRQRLEIRRLKRVSKLTQAVAAKQKSCPTALV